MLDLGFSLSGLSAFPVNNGEPPEEVGFVLVDAEGNGLSDAENNQLMIGPGGLED